MQFVGKVISSVSEFYKDINPATLSGAIDVVVVEDAVTGELTCSPFHVRFGKLQLLRPQEKAVELCVNGEPLGERLRMKVGEAGETFFVLPRVGETIPAEYLTSPLIAAQTPVPIESVDEIKLNATSDTEFKESLTFPLGTPIITNVPSNTNISTTTNTLTTSPIATSTATMQESPAIGPDSPEWKWQWGDLPTRSDSWEGLNKDEGKNESEISKESEVGKDGKDGKQTTIPSTSISTNDTWELYQYLGQDAYLKEQFKVLNLMPTKSITLRVLRIDRGLHFIHGSQDFERIQVGKVVPFQEFYADPAGLIEHAARIVVEFGCAGRVVWLPGALGIVLAVGISLWGRTIDDEGAFLRLGRMINFEFDLEAEVAEEGGVKESLAVASKERDGPVVTAESKAVEVPKSSWKSWWSRGSESKKASAVGKESAVTNTSNTSNTLVTLNTLNATSIAAMSSTNTTPSISQSNNNTSNSSINTNTSFFTTHSQSQSSQSQLQSSQSQSQLQLQSSQSQTQSQTQSQSSLPISVALHSPAPSTPHVIHRTTSPSPSVSSFDSLSTSAASSTQYIKSLRLPSATLKSLNLRPGVNTISYTVNTRLQGTATCQSRIFLWRSDARVVISDIDGTITKSDALGHLFTMVGKDWTHVGVASLYSKIAANGYEFLYLTSRAIGQAASTRGYLKGIEQDRFQLPDGPVIMSPDRLFTALHREVIQRRPDEFKIACLRDIQRLFIADEESVNCMGSGVISSSEDESPCISRLTLTGPYNESVMANSSTSTLFTTTSSSSSANTTTNTSVINPAQNPFYAGFGNRPTDTKSYKAVGIPTSRIFLINSTGDLKLDRLTVYTPYSASSYVKLTEEVDKVFPPLRSPHSLVRQAGDEAFTDFQYWTGGGIRMDLVAELLKKTVNEKVMTEKSAEKNSDKIQSKQQEIVPLPSGEGLVVVAGVSNDIEESIQGNNAFTAVAVGRVIVSSPGRRRSESVSKMAQVRKLSFTVDGEADADVEEEEAEEEDEMTKEASKQDKAVETEDDYDDDDEDEGTSVASITSYPFM